ncbi:hypothetical protein COT72_03420 [archaeon CG10_big_fil_rev_8_21_14_0_10_43_11]|nr:MAG: hypothetical protein COT72_03420 [archaeon CG10_big_fil_rev_8_21_14_0_10_43_11]
MNLKRFTVLPALVSLVLLSVTGAFGQDISGALQTVGVTLGVLIEGFRTPEAILLLSRLFAFAIIVGVTYSIGEMTGRRGAAAGLQNGAKIFGIVVAVATSLLAPPTYLLLFFYFGAILGQFILFGVVLFFVWQIFQGGGGEEPNKFNKILGGLALAGTGLFFLALAGIMNFEIISQVITQGYLNIDQDLLNSVNTLGSFGSFLNLGAVFYGLYQVWQAISSNVGLAGVGLLGAGAGAAFTKYFTGGKKAQDDAQENQDQIEEQIEQGDLVAAINTQSQQIEALSQAVRSLLENNEADNQNQGGNA